MTRIFARLAAVLCAGTCVMGGGLTGEAIAGGTVAADPPARVAPPPIAGWPAQNGMEAPSYPNLLSSHACREMVQGYVDHHKIPVQTETLRAEALEWSTTRGSRSGRVAWQYVQDLAGRLGVTLG